MISFLSRANQIKKFSLNKYLNAYILQQRSSWLDSLPLTCSQCRQNRFCSSSINNGKSSYFITTPIFYANAAPHIGHLYSCVIADAAARFNRLQGSQVIFSTGTDEHGLKIQQAAEKWKKDPLVFTDEVSHKFKDMFDSYNISYTDFIRTTETRHKTTVQQFWELLETRGHIYKGKYEGWYSVSDEAYLGDNEIKEIERGGETIKVSVDSEQPVTWMEEENYMFRLSDFKDRLIEWLDTGAIQPELFEHEVRQTVEQLTDLSVSRVKSRLQWGIPVPDRTDTQTIYVWLDALVNYLTVAGYPDMDNTWPADCHIVGKDIIRFHAVYWPAFLMAAGLEPPKKIFCHSHWLCDNIKMSKSRGNTMNPMKLLDKYPADVFRYYLLRNGVPHSDGNYLPQEAIEYVNADIVNTMGNLLSRCVAPAVNPAQMYPRIQQDVYLAKFTAADRETFETMDILIDTVVNHFNNLHFYQGIESLMSYMRWANGLIQQHESWVLVKSHDPIDHAHLKTLIHISLETLRVTGILLQPIIPLISEKLLNRLGIPQDKRTIDHARKPYLNSPEHLPLGPNEGVILHKLKDEDKIQKNIVRKKKQKSNKKFKKIEEIGIEHV